MLDSAVSTMGRESTLDSRHPDPSQHLRDDSIAIRPAELVEVALGEIDLLRKRLAQQAAGAEMACANRRLGNAQTLRGLLDAHFFDGTQHEDYSESLGQRVELALEQRAHFRADEGLVGRPGIARFAHLNLPLDIAVERHDRHDVVAARLSAQTAEALVEDQPRQ